MQLLETNRLQIRELTPEDFDALYAIYFDDSVRKYVTHFTTDKDREYARFLSYIRLVYGFYGFGLWGLFEKAHGQLIGQAGIESQSIDGQGEIVLSYLLDSAFQGQGYAEEACREILQYAQDVLSFSRIAAVIHPQNARSIHLAEKLGFQYERETLFQGKPHHLYLRVTDAKHAPQPPA